MAGRGTDIKLGGDPHSFALKVGEFGSPEYHEAYMKCMKKNVKRIRKSSKCRWTIYPWN